MRMLVGMLVGGYILSRVCEYVRGWVLRDECTQRKEMQGKQGGGRGEIKAEIIGKSRVSVWEGGGGAERVKWEGNVEGRGVWSVEKKERMNWWEEGHFFF